MHLTVQTERSDGVAGTRGGARAPASPSRTGTAPPSRRGRWELPAWSPELLQPGGQQGPVTPSHPSLVVGLTVMLPP